jgi:hypothetical protein
MAIAYRGWVSRSLTAASLGVSWELDQGASVRIVLGSNSQTAIAPATPSG